MPSTEEQIKAIEEVISYFHQEFEMWKFKDMKKQDITYKLHCAIQTLKKQ